MSQQFPTSASAIHDALSADAVFLELLGDYNFKANSGPLKALSVVSPGQDLPSLRTVSGVECIIQDVGVTTAQNYLTDAPYMVTSFSVFCIAWAPANGGDMQAATDHIMRRFVGAESVQTVATPEGLGALVQSQVIIKSNMPIRPD
jgi:hypothetical protein